MDQCKDILIIKYFQNQNKSIAKTKNKHLQDSKLIIYMHNKHKTIHRAKKDITQWMMQVVGCLRCLQAGQYALNLATFGWHTHFLNCGWLSLFASEPSRNPLTKNSCMVVWRILKFLSTSDTCNRIYTYMQLGYLINTYIYYMNINTHILVARCRIHIETISILRLLHLILWLS